MAMSLRELLERRFGVDEAAFSDALAEFADRTGPLAIVALRPSDYFGDAQRATLGELGATLEPMRAGQVGPIAGLAAAYGQLVAQSLTVAVVARRLRVDTSRVRQRIYTRSLYAFKHRGAWLVPAFQLDGRRLLPGLAAVVRQLSPGLHPVAVSRWFTTPNPDLLLAGEAIAPVAWLGSGAPAEPVAELAEAIDQL
jgi:hypothetical protein